MLLLGIGNLVGDQQKRFHWAVVMASGATNCIVAIVGLFVVGKRDLK